jgi:hypothetical protein
MAKKNISNSDYFNQAFKNIFKIQLIPAFFKNLGIFSIFLFLFLILILIDVYDIYSYPPESRLDIIYYESNFLTSLLILISLSLFFLFLFFFSIISKGAQIFKIYKNQKQEACSLIAAYKKGISKFFSIFLWFLIKALILILAFGAFYLPINLLFINANLDSLISYLIPAFLLVLMPFVLIVFYLYIQIIYSLSQYFFILSDLSVNQAYQKAHNFLKKYKFKILNSLIISFLLTSIKLVVHGLLLFCFFFFFIIIDLLVLTEIYALIITIGLLYLLVMLVIFTLIYGSIENIKHYFWILVLRDLVKINQKKFNKKNKTKKIKKDDKNKPDQWPKDNYPPPQQLDYIPIDL